MTDRVQVENGQIRKEIYTLLMDTSISSIEDYRIRSYVVPYAYCLLLDHSYIDKPNIRLDEYARHVVDGLSSSPIASAVNTVFTKLTDEQILSFVIPDRSGSFDYLGSNKRIYSDNDAPGNNIKHLLNVGSGTVCYKVGGGNTACCYLVLNKDVDLVKLASQIPGFSIVLYEQMLESLNGKEDIGNGQSEFCLCFPINSHIDFDKLMNTYMRRVVIGAGGLAIVEDDDTIASELKKIIDKKYIEAIVNAGKIVCSGGVYEFNVYYVVLSHDNERIKVLNYDTYYPAYRRDDNKKYAKSQHRPVDFNDHLPSFNEAYRHPDGDCCYYIERNVLKKLNCWQPDLSPMYMFKIDDNNKGGETLTL